MWEYYTTTIVSPGQDQASHDARMRELGDNGWELCGVGDLSNHVYRMFFKRPKSWNQPYR